MDHVDEAGAVIGLLLLLPGLALGGVSTLTSEQSPQGGSAEGRAGDVLITTGDARFVISALDHAVGVHSSGGNLVDAWVAPHDDVFDGLAPWFERDYPRQAHWTGLQQRRDSVRVTGHDTDDDAIAVVQTFQAIAAPGAAGALVITTELTNTSSTARPDFDLGDLVGWGGLRHFAPGPGHRLSGTDEELRWLGAEGEDYAALLVVDGRVTGPHGASWSDPVYDVASIPPGLSVRYRRTLLLGRTLGELTLAAATLRGRDVLTATIEARDERTGAPVPDAALTLLHNGRPELVGRTDAEGRLTAALPAGTYRVTARTADRAPRQPATITVPSPDPAVVTLSPQGRVRLVATDGRNRPMPARFTFEGIDAPDPDLGPPSRAIGGNRVHLTSAEQVALPPGRYLVTVSRGPAWTRVTREFSVSPTAPGDTSPELRVSLQRVLARDGWLQCDLHTHSAPSFDSAIPLEDGLIAAAAEGVDCIATTDHDVTADFAEALKSTGLLGHLLWLPGLEITSEEGAGHINAYPWAPERGRWDHRGRTAADIVDGVRGAAPGAILQLNHPMWGAIGLWSAQGIDPSTGLPRTVRDDGTPTGATTDFDVVEVLNGKDVAGFGKVVDAWERMLDAGVRSRAVGNSDSHRIVGQERGSMRTWIRVGANRSAAAVTQALRGDGEVVASNAPLVRVQRRGGGFRVTVEAASWVPLDSVELHAGDPTRIGSWVPRSWRRGDPAIEEAVVDGLRRWTVDVTLPEEALDGWILAVARGDQTMEPWLDAPAYGLSNPLWLD